MNVMFIRKAKKSDTLMKRLNVLEGKSLELLTKKTLQLLSLSFFSVFDYLSRV